VTKKAAMAQPKGGECETKGKVQTINERGDVKMIIFKAWNMQRSWDRLYVRE